MQRAVGWAASLGKLEDVVMTRGQGGAKRREIGSARAPSLGSRQEMARIETGCFELGDRVRHEGRVTPPADHNRVNLQCQESNARQGR